MKSIRTILSRLWPAQVLCALSVLALFLILLHWYRPGYVLQSGDNAFPYAPMVYFAKSFFAWNRVGAYVGAGWSGGIWATWQLAASVLVAALGVGLGQIVMIWLSIAGAWVGAYWLFRNLRVSCISAIVAAWAYVINPWNQILAGINPPLNWAYALAPWIVGLAVTAALHDDRRPSNTALLALIAFALVPVCAANPALVVALALVYALGVGLGMVLTRDRRQYGRWAMLTAAYSVIASLWWLFIVGYDFLSGPIATTISAQDWAWVIGRSSLLNNLRLNPFWGWAHPEYFSYARAYDSNVLQYAAGFLLSISAAFALMLTRKRWLTVSRYSAGVAVLSFLLSKGLHPPVSWLNNLLYHMPLAGMFREPTSKAPIVAILFLAITCGMAVDAVRLTRWRTQLWIRFAAVPAASIMIVASGWQMITGTQFHGYTLNYHNNVVGLPPEFVRLPTYWSDVARYLNDRARSDGGLLVLPEDPYYQVDYDWGLYGADYLANWMINRPVWTPGLHGYTTSPEMKSIDETIIASLRNKLRTSSRTLQDLGVAFVLYRGDLRWNSYDRFPVNLEDLRGALPRARELHFGPLVLMELQAPLTQLRVSRTYNIGAYGDFSTGDMLALRAITEDAPRVEMDSAPRLLGIAPNYLENDLGARPQSYHGPALVELPRLLRTIGTGMFAQQNAILDRISDVQVTAVFAGQDSNRFTFDLGPTTPGSRPASAGTLLISPTDVYSDDDGNMYLSFFNPTTSVLFVDLSVEESSPVDTIWTLSGAGGIDEDFVAASPDVVALQFPRVRLAPGISNLVLHPNSYKGERPLQRFPVAPGGRVGVVGVFPTQIILRPTEIGCSSFKALCSVRSIGGYALNVPLASSPRIQIYTNIDLTGSPVYGLVAIEYDRNSFLCLNTLDSTLSMDLAPIVYRCLSRLYRSLDSNKIQVRSVEFLLESSNPPLPGDIHIDRADMSLASSSDISTNMLAPNVEAEGVGELPVTEREANYAISIPWKETHPDRYFRRSSLVGRRVLVVLAGGARAPVEGTLVSFSPPALAIRYTDGRYAYIPSSAIDEITPDQRARRVVVRWPIAGKILPGMKFAVRLSGYQIDDGSAELLINGRIVERAALRVNPDGHEAEATLDVGTRGAADRAQLRLELILASAPDRDASYQIGVGMLTRRNTGGVLILSKSANLLLSGAPGEWVSQRVSAPSGLIAARSLDGRLSALAIGNPPCECSLETPIGELPLSGVSLMRIGSTRQLLVANVPYSSVWLAVRLWPWPSPLRNLKIDNWRTGWYVDPGGDVLIINLANVLQLVLMVMGCLTVIRAGWKRESAP